MQSSFWTFRFPGMPRHPQCSHVLFPVTLPKLPGGGGAAPRERAAEVGALLKEVPPQQVRWRDRRWPAGAAAGPAALAACRLCPPFSPSRFPTEVTARARWCSAQMTRTHSLKRAY